MVFQEVLLIAAIPGAFIIGIAVLGTVRAVRNAPEKGRRLAVLPPVLLVATVIPWLGFDVIYRSADLTMEDSLAILMLVASALLSFGAFLSAGLVGLFLSVRYRRQRSSSPSHM